MRKHGSFKVLASVFIVLFILVTPFTSEIVKEQLIIGDIGIAGWIELWGDRLASLSRGDLMGIFIFKLVVANTIIALIGTIITFIFLPPQK